MSKQMETRCIHGNSDFGYQESTRAVSFPIYQTATFGHIGLGQSSGVTRLFQVISQKNGLSVSYADTTDLEKVRKLLRPETRALYIETPSNPMMNVTDLRACAALAKEHGLLLIVDNTFLSPYLQNPIELGADLVLHSGTKFLGGHNDTICGFLYSATPELTEQSRVTRVFYAGLPEHPGYEINRSQARGAGSMISFRTDSVETTHRVLEKVRLITFAESLGGTESLITYPMTQTHKDVPEEMRRHLGITDMLLRLSVGLEHVDDIIADLAQALEA